jgi:hypothetical protein
MPELARSIAARLRKFIGDRRRAERRRLQLPFALSLVDERSAGSATQSHSIDGHTLDVSTTGLALIVPAIRIGDHYLAGEGRVLRIDLELPVGPIVMQATAVRYERLDEDETERGYLIGVNITAISDSDRARYHEYLAGFLTK